MLRSESCTKTHIDSSAYRWDDAGAGVLNCAECEVLGVSKVIHAELDVVVFDLQSTRPIHYRISRYHTYLGIGAENGVVGILI